MVAVVVMLVETPVEDPDWYAKGVPARLSSLAATCAGHAAGPPHATSTLNVAANDLPG